MELKPPTRRFKWPPMSILTVAVIVGLAVVVAVTMLANDRPWLGLGFSVEKDQVVVVAGEGPGKGIPAGTVVVKVGSGADEMELEAGDLLSEPDGVIPDYETYRRFIARQDRLARIQEADEFFLTDAEGRVRSLRPDGGGRPLGDFPVVFWVGLVVGLTAWLVSAGVFAFRPGEASARYLLLSGAATLIFAPAAAIYSTRELAVDGTVFRWASDLNFFGGSLFAASFVALLLHYPRRLAPAWVGISVVSLYVVWFVAQQVDVFESMIFARRFLVMVGVAATFVLAGVHWFGTRRDPVGRAALQWFLLSWVLGSGLFALFILLPQTFGVDTTPVQGYAFLLFLLVYGGLAFGILRYRLFELGVWWRRVAVWTVSVLILVLLDLFFLFSLQMSTGVSLSLALLVCGVVWLPLRAWIWRWFAGRGKKPMGDLFGQVMDVSLAPKDGGQDVRWRELLESVFDPLNVISKGSSVAEVTLDGDGLGMCVPGVGAGEGLRLEYSRGGRGLFTPRDADLARELVTMLRHGIESRDAYEKGVAEERGRIARDMHDNIGAQLLAALHSRDTASKDGKIREALTDLRDVINNASAGHLSIGETLADLRIETAERLAAAGIGLGWTGDGNDSHHLNTEVTHALRSIVREAVSNIIRHSGATRVGIVVHGSPGWVGLEIVDDGHGFDPASVECGQGLSNMRSRVELLGGSLEIENTGSGTRLELRIPIHEVSH